jgi:hypothetical protein
VDGGDCGLEGDLLWRMRLPTCKMSVSRRREMYDIRIHSYLNPIPKADPTHSYRRKLRNLDLN